MQRSERDAKQGLPPERYYAITASRLPGILKERGGMGDREILEARAVASVWPFKTNDHVLSLIDWSGDFRRDPMYVLTMPQPGMLRTHELSKMAGLLDEGASRKEIAVAAAEIRRGANPHPAGQVEDNKALLSDGDEVEGVQHKYPETVLLFDKRGQTCHAYCTYCFRWPQFVEPDLRIDRKSVV